MDYESTPTPDHVDPQTDAVAERIFELHDKVKVVATQTKQFADFLKTYTTNPESDKGEMIANAILAYRHLEDAGMRIWKVMLAKNEETPTDADESSDTPTDGMPTEDAAEAARCDC